MFSVPIVFHLRLVRSMRKITIQNSRQLFWIELKYEKLKEMNGGIDFKMGSQVLFNIFSDFRILCSNWFEYLNPIKNTLNNVRMMDRFLKKED